MVDGEAAATEAGSSSGNQGSGAPTEAPAGTPAKTYSQEEWDTAHAKMRRAVTAETQKQTEAALLKELGVKSREELQDRLKQSPPAKPEPSEAEKIAEKVRADYERQMSLAKAEAEAAKKALADERLRREQEQLRAYMHGLVNDTNDPNLAMAVFGLPFTAEREIRIVDGKPTVFEDGTPLPHIDASDYVKKTLAKPEMAFLRKPTQVGTGTRVGPTPTAATEPETPRDYRKVQAGIKKGVASLFANRGGLNGGR